MSKYAGDRHWRRRMALSVALTALTLGLLGVDNYPLLAVLALGLLHGALTPARMFAAPYDGIGVFFVFGVSYFLLALWASAIRAQWRMALRNRICSGAQNILPLARPLDDLTPPADGMPEQQMGSQSLRLSWQEPHHRPGPRRLMVVVVVFVGICVLAGVGALTLPITIAPTLLIVLYLTFFPGVFVAIIAYFLIARWLSRRHAAPDQWTRDVIADEAGVTWRRPRRPDVSVRWADARLLEVALTPPGNDIPPWPIYSLWAADGRTTISWPVYTLSAATPPRGAADEADESARMALAQASRDLIRLIRLRAGLDARTFDAKLMADTQQARPWYYVILEGSMRVVWTYALPTLYGVFLPVIGALAILLLPLSSLLWVNIYGAFLLLVVAGFIGGALWRQWRRERPAPVASPRMPATHTAPAGDDNALYTLAQRTAPGIVLGVWLLAPLCASAGAVGLAALANPGGNFGAQTFGAALIIFVASVLALTMASGVGGLIYGMVASGPRRLLANQGQLSMARGESATPTTSIPWQKVTAIFAFVRRDGTVAEYRVTGNDAQRAVIIGWRTAPRSVIARPSPRPLLRSARAVTPDELAALVVARTGLPLTLRQA